MNSFTQPKRGESGEEFQKRRTEMIEFVARKHGWDIERTVRFLESLSHIGIAYIGVDIESERRAAAELAREFSPFPW